MGIRERLGNRMNGCRAGLGDPHEPPDAEDERYDSEEDQPVGSEIGVRNPTEDQDDPIEGYRHRLRDLSVR